MAKAIHGDPEVDATARRFIRGMLEWATPDMQRQLSGDVLAHFESASHTLIAAVILYRAARSKQSPKARNPLSKPSMV